MSPSSPFDVIIITSPDQKAATAVRQLIISSCGDFSNNQNDSSASALHATDGTIFLSSCDPYDARLGSGGGTIAALAEAYEAYYNCHTDLEKDIQPTVLICHAGGESSRCPTQITLGKAWTSLPSCKNGEINNPTSLLISMLSSMFRDVPRSSVVVAASDCLISFPSWNNDDENTIGSDEGKKIKFDDNNCKGIFGLAVPAPLSTAKNHGVFVLDDHNNNGNCNHNDEDGWRLQSTFKVLQKPSVNDMISINNPPCVFHTAANDTTEVDTRMAWIDTGVITFLPDAVETLRELSRSELKNCTRVGLAESYREKCGGSSAAELRVEEYAKSVAPKICLYGDMLHALQTTSSPSCDTTLLGALSKHELQTCIIPEGTFFHLGTTGELIEFLAAGASTKNDDDKSGDDDLQRKKVKSFAKSIGITSRSNAFIAGFRRDCFDDTSFVVLNSILMVDGFNSKSCIGEGTVIEHCTIPFSRAESIDNGRIVVGKRCLLSGIRGDLKGRDLRVPSEMCLQILPLREGLGGFVCLCFGVNDSIKEATTLYGMDLNQVLDRSGLTSSDLWDESIPSRRTLWNAKINPIIMCADEEECPELNFSFLEWIQSLRDGVKPDTTALEGLRQWKESKRIAICDIRECVDSEAEVNYRSTISSVEVEQLNSVTDCILGGKNEPCNFDYLGVRNDLDHLKGHPTIKRALKALDCICYQAVEEGKFHILSRALMVMSDLISTLHSKFDESESTEFNLPLTLSSEAIEQVIATRDRILSEEKHSSYCQLLECMSSFATQRCMSTDGTHSHIYTDPLPLDTTVVASAPARIDLAGAWSDTPPVCYEHGGAVACLAVLVDGKRPLRAKCRVAKGMRGIRLRTESRALDEGETLLRSSEVTINTLGDMNSFNDPETECALLKCALVWLGLCPVECIQDDDRETQSIQPFLQKFCQREGEDDVGLEVISSSLLPTGSGMGSSSILAGCIIASIAKCIGVKIEGMELDRENLTSTSTRINGTNSLIDGVLMVEQLLTSGGGWQDQIGGLVGGLKLGASDKNIPLQTKTTRYELSVETINKLNQRLILVFTGKPRLAKNILRNVLRRWAKRSSDIVRTVHELVSEASNAIHYTTKGDLVGVGTCMSKNWNLKKTMAGENSGVEPENVNKVLRVLTSTNHIAGGALCGAGGGGFLALIATEGRSRGEIESAVSIAGVGAENFKWHCCKVAKDGLLIEVN